MSQVFYLSDTANRAVRKVDASGIINTLSLTSVDSVYVANGGLISPFGMAVDASGNIFLVDQAAAVIYKISPSLVVTRVAGNGVGGAVSGDGGPALSANMLEPCYIALDVAGNLYFSDNDQNNSHSQIIRAVNMQGTTQTLLGVSIAAGNIQTVAGIVNSPGHGGMGGPAIAAQLTSPFGVVIDAGGSGPRYGCY
jgi:hypothetical protein